MTNVWPLLAPSISNSVLFKEIVVHQLTPVPLDLATIGNTSTALTGSFGGGAVNTTVAAILTLRTGLAGKTHRGRMYIAGISATSLNGNAPGPVLITSLSNFASGMLGLYGTAGTSAICEWGIYSRVLGGSGPFTVAGYQPINRVDVQGILGNQRRRRVGVGI